MSRTTHISGAGLSSLEFLIVLTIVGLLVSVAIPAYQRARNTALIGSVVGQLMSYAQACMVINASGVGERPLPPSMSPVRGGLRITVGCDGEDRGAILEASWGNARAPGIRCATSLSSVSSSRATILIDRDNNITCRFED